MLITITKRNAREYILEPKPEAECDLGIVYLRLHSEPKNMPWHLVTFGRNFETPEAAAEYLNGIVEKWNDPPTEADIQRENEIRASERKYQSGYAYACDCCVKYAREQAERKTNEPHGLARLDALRQFVEPFAKQRCVLNPVVGNCIDGNREHPCRPCRARLALEGTGRVGLAKLTAPDLAELRAVILRVIDDGCTCGEDDPNMRKHPWELHEGMIYDNTMVDDATADQQRLRFCDAIQAAIVAKAAPATAAGDHDFRPMPQNPQWCAYFGCLRDRDSH